MNSISNTFYTLIKENKKPALVITLLGFACLCSYFLSNSTHAQQSNSESDFSSIDTYIPKNHVLVPIQLVNGESLQNIIGKLGGVVDLYLPQDNKKSIKVANRVKLLKAPLNPNEFAVLVHESESPQILSYNGPFIAVIQNPAQTLQQNNSQVISDTKPKKVYIEYYNN